MSDLKKQIEHKKHEINRKRKDLKSNWKKGKRKFSKSLSFDASLLGGLLLGYFIIPRRFFKIVMKAWSIYSSVRRVSEFISEKTGQTIHEAPVKKLNKPARRPHRTRRISG